MKKKESNYDKFKRDALVRFLTYDQEPLIRRLHLDADDTWIYISFCGRQYRLHRSLPLMERKALGITSMEQRDQGTVSAEQGSGETLSLPECEWQEADCNAVLTICDLLCHTTEPIQLSGSFTTLEGLNRVKGGTVSTLGDGFYRSTEACFDKHLQELKKACESLGGVPAGKGDAAYRIPLFGSIALQISFYESDDEFPAQLTFFLDQKICSYLFYETLWYLILLVMDELKRRIGY